MALADQIARQQWAVLADDDPERQATFVGTSDGVLGLIATALGDDDHRVLANRARVAMARKDMDSAADLLQKAADATDDDVQKSVYLGLIEEDG